jgi:hypothetical protein
MILKTGQLLTFVEEIRYVLFLSHTSNLWEAYIIKILISSGPLKVNTSMMVLTVPCLHNVKVIESLHLTNDKRIDQQHVYRNQMLYIHVPQEIIPSHSQNINFL